MRRDVFEALAPVCPRCLHGEAGRSAPLVVGSVEEERAGRIWHGLLVCSDRTCWAEYPVLAGIPILLADPAPFLREQEAGLLADDDLPPLLAGALGDALGQGSAFGGRRHHLGLYAQDHLGDWAGGARGPGVVEIVRQALAATGPLRGPALDLGGSVGRGAWEMAAAGAGPVAVIDLNLGMLRLGQRLATEGRAPYPVRRLGLVFDRAEAVLPAEAAEAAVDFWLADVLALPFADAAFGAAAAVNLVDCVPGPTNLIVEMARVLGPDAPAIVATPYDWQASVTDPSLWFGGHSARAEHGGAPEPVLRATLAHHGLEPVAEAREMPWRLRLGERAAMTYSVDLVVARRRLA